ncbi:MULTISPECIES: MFS transporter [Actinomadura]|uniref:MFS transporter n=1 Tax=Actinomadura TaxID=1988 RepID=UPI000463AD8A|nr:MFS transporter [Actinomadura madurae]MCP9951306.1 MHS family MFS transporter [Actinomadura madurae]MCP9968077.1 MHS family MFS transporter [Actinomadura madurae]MCQ0007945.1 MHS family MFS transporter [Actinomadura madurae]MCQ0016736.1 MHS family MFS transporter [Actinomadura madurae]URN07514.1 MHS family MFS transporter [Actinomadura madurae]
MSHPSSSGGPTRPWRVAVAGLIGTTIEWYDFFIYALAATLVFAPQFFPSASTLASNLAALSTFAIGFVARPVGGALIGHFGDRVGRKRMLVLSLLVMGVGTALIGLLPTYATIGVAAPIVLVLVRLAQGLAVGGEWGGATLLALEHARTPAQRTLFSSLPQVGLPLGVVLSSLAFLLVRLGFGDAGFVDWGWRIPFLASAVLVAVGLVIRLKLDESPEFEHARRRRTVRRAPIIDVLRAPRIWVPASGITIGSSTLGNLLLAFMLSHASRAQLFSASTMLTVTIVAALLWSATLPLAALLAGRVGRKRLLISGSVCLIVWAYPYFALVESQSRAALFIGTIVAALCIAVVTGPYGAYLSEAFPTEIRYSGASVAYGIGGVLGGAIAPIVATLLVTSTGGLVAVAGYVALASLVSLVAVLTLRSPHPEEWAARGRVGPAAGAVQDKAEA